MDEENETTDTISDELQYLSGVNLVMAMFRLVAQDLRYGNNEAKKDARQFLRSAWFKVLCEDVNLNPERVKFAIKKSDRITIRSNYE